MRDIDAELDATEEAAANARRLEDQARRMIVPPATRTAARAATHINSADEPRVMSGLPHLPGGYYYMGGESIQLPEEGFTPAADDDEAAAVDSYQTAEDDRRHALGLPADATEAEVAAIEQELERRTSQPLSSLPPSYFWRMFGALPDKREEP